MRSELSGIKLSNTEMFQKCCDWTRDAQFRPEWVLAILLFFLK